MRFKKEIMMEPFCITLKLSNMTLKTTFSSGLDNAKKFHVPFLAAKVLFSAIAPLHMRPRVIMPRH